MIPAVEIFDKHLVVNGFQFSSNTVILSVGYFATQPSAKSIKQLMPTASQLIIMTLYILPSSITHCPYN
jgi:hypothetical protein